MSKCLLKLLRIRDSGYVYKFLSFRLYEKLRVLPFLSSSALDPLSNTGNKTGALATGFRNGIDSDALEQKVNFCEFVETEVRKIPVFMNLYFEIDTQAVKQRFAPFLQS